LNHATTVKSADRTVHLLELFAEHPDGLTLTDVTDLTGWPKSSSLALLRTLQLRQYLDNSNDTGKYRLGPRVAFLGTAYLGNLDLAREGVDIVREVSRACDETVHLAVLRGTDVLYVAKEEGGGHMRMVSMVGRMIPAHGTGVGKMLLASLPPERIDALYPAGQDLPRLTDRTTTDRQAFIRRLEHIREQGYATDSGESTLGIECLAAPVFDVNAQVIAAMSISVPEPRFSSSRVPALLATLIDGVRQLSIRMGCPPTALSAYPAIERSEVQLGAR
jgi:DNA-binding IclR family transcriptional regulator